MDAPPNPLMADDTPKGLNWNLDFSTVHDYGLMNWTATKWNTYGLYTCPVHFDSVMISVDRSQTSQCRILHHGNRLFNYVRY